MKTTYEGWNMPKLSKKNADFWCKQVASANPSVGARYQAFLQEMGLSGISVEEIRVDRDLKAKVPYKVTISYTLQGDTPVKINQACFTWSGEGPYCFPVKLDTKKREASLMLHTGRPDTYSLSGALRYNSEGKTSMSNWYTNEIVVHR